MPDLPERLRMTQQRQMMTRRSILKNQLVTAGLRGVKGQQRRGLTDFVQERRKVRHSEFLGARSLAARRRSPTAVSSSKLLSFGGGGGVGFGQYSSRSRGRPSMTRRRKSPDRRIPLKDYKVQAGIASLPASIWTTSGRIAYGKMPWQERIRKIRRQTFGRSRWNLAESKVARDIEPRKAGVLSSPDKTSLTHYR